MRILPILFNTDMVRAILDGRKTATRRTIKPKHRNACGFQVNIRKSDGQVVGIYDYDENEQEFEQPHTLPYVPGDILYVRETWQDLCLPVKSGKQTHDYAYKASDNDKNIKWRPSIHMPKAAARIWLKVTDVRVERLQDIDDDGVVAEGLQIGDPFEELWDSTVKKADRNLYGWDANPWVWVIEFERCEKPEEWSV